MNITKAATLKESMAKWLVFNHLPHATTQSTEFREMLQFFDKKFVPFERRTFNDEIDTMFASMIVGIVKLLADNIVHGLAAVSITHDL